MPEICRFLGIIIYLYYNDHAPPHIHVRYNDYQALIDSPQLKLIEGKLPSRVLGLVMEWALLHQAELQENWQRAVNLQPVQPILPLE
jgi:hypothetical protein